MEYTYYRNPGLFFDLYRVFIFKLNKRPIWMNQVANVDYENDDIRYVAECMKRFPDPDRKLILFFFLKDRKSNSYFSTIYKKLFFEFQENMELDCFLEYFSDPERILREICDFYIGPEADPHNPKEFSKAVMKVTDLKDSEVKFQLLYFSIKPVEVVQVLRESLIQYYQVLDKMYAEKQPLLQETMEQLDVDLLQRGIKSYVDKMMDDTRLIKLSFTLVNKNVVTGMDEFNWYIFGWDYRKTMLNELDILFDPKAFGEALGDGNRIRILECILKEGEISGGELAKRLGVALNTVSYHLEVMQRSRLLYKRKQGKSTYYWLNVRMCEKAVEMINQWIEMGGGAK